MYRLIFVTSFSELAEHAKVTLLSYKINAGASSEGENALQLTHSFAEEDYLEYRALKMELVPHTIGLDL